MTIIIILHAGIGAVGNLQVLNKNQSYIRLAWHPIPGPLNSGNTATNITAIITYRVNVIVNNTFTGLLHNQLFETRDTRFVYTPNNGSPCEHYTLSVTPIINVVYEGIEAIIQEIYLFQGIILLCMYSYPGIIIIAYIIYNL